MLKTDNIQAFLIYIQNNVESEGRFCNNKCFYLDSFENNTEICNLFLEKLNIDGFYNYERCTKCLNYFD